MPPLSECGFTIRIKAGKKHSSVPFNVFRSESGSAFQRIPLGFSFQGLTTSYPGIKSIELNPAQQNIMKL